MRALISVTLVFVRRRRKRRTEHSSSSENGVSGDDNCNDNATAIRERLLSLMRDYAADNG